MTLSRSSRQLPIASLIGSMTLLAAGCISAPRPSPTLSAAPARYTADEPLQETVADGVAQHFTAGARPVPDWWGAYQSQALNALVDEGLAHSPSLAAVQQTLRATREQLRAQIGDNLYPSVDVAFVPSRQRALGVPFLPQQTFLYNVFAAEAQASYRFDFFGAALLADRALAQQVEQQGYQLDATRRALATNIVLATINVAALREALDASQALASLAEQNAQQLAARAKLGSASQSEALTAEQSAAAASGALPGLRAQLLAVQHAQAVLLGRSPDQAPAPLPLESLQLPQEVPVSVPSDLLHRRPDILAAESGMHAAANEAGAATALLFPSLTLTAAWGHGGFDWSTFTSPAGVIWSVGATLSQPLFHGGALRARRRQYQDLYEASQSAYRQTVLAAFENVADTLAALESDADALAQSRRAADAAQRSEADVQARFHLGGVAYVATLAAGEQYQNARVTLARARAARLADTATLFEALGELPDGPHPPMTRVNP